MSFLGTRTIYRHWVNGIMGVRLIMQRGYSPPPYFVLECIDLPVGLEDRIQNVLMPGANNSHLAQPTEIVNIEVTKDAHRELVFVAELAAWRNAIGYCYNAQNPPKTKAEFDALPKYIAFSNYSMWNWSSNPVLWAIICHRSIRGLISRCAISMKMANNLIFSHKGQQWVGLFCLTGSKSIIRAIAN